MRGFVLVILAGAVLLVPAMLIAEALDFGRWARLATIVVVMVLASLVDRDGFYGPRESS